MKLINNVINVHVQPSSLFIFFMMRLRSNIRLFVQQQLGFSEPLQEGRRFVQGLMFLSLSSLITCALSGRSRSLIQWKTNLFKAGRAAASFNWTLLRELLLKSTLVLSADCFIWNVQRGAETPHYAGIHRKRGNNERCLIWVHSACSSISINHSAGNKVQLLHRICHVQQLQSCSAALCTQLDSNSTAGLLCVPDEAN